MICKRAKVHGGSQDDGLLPPRTLKTVNPFDVVKVGIQAEKLALATAESFDREWLCRYPQPREFVHDQGTEFTGAEFQELLSSYGIKDKPITAKNPQANAICERVHLKLLNIIRCYEDVDLKKAIYYATFAVRASYYNILNASPGQLLFGQDMISRQLHSAIRSICQNAVLTRS